MSGWRRTLIAGVIAGMAVSAVAWRVTSAEKLPDRIADAEFWRMVTTFSELGGSFPSNNFVSNETAYQVVVPSLRATAGTGGVYLGVGPDQNFTYITALKPKIAFIIDIRRQNLLHHLLYKSLIERSPTRIEFLSRLFSRPRPPGLADDATPEALMTAFRGVAPSPELFDTTTRELREHLTVTHKFALSESDLATIRFVHQAFFDGGPDLTYAGTVNFGANTGPMITTVFPTFGHLANAADAAGTNHGYLSSAETYRILRDLQLKNLIVPVVGDFAGPKAIRAVGAYLTEHAATVSAFYTSNVEQYLFQNQVWRQYYDNVATLPLLPTSQFIRSFFPNPTVRFTFGTDGPPSSVPLSRFIASSSLLCPITELIDAVRAGKVNTYADVIAMSK